MLGSVAWPQASQRLIGLEQDPESHRRWRNVGLADRRNRRRSNAITRRSADPRATVSPTASQRILPPSGAAQETRSLCGQLGGPRRGTIYCLYVDVFILGAGFSHAVSKRMPLLKHLSHQVLDRMTETDRALVHYFDRNDVESWLSFLGADQPWLDEAARLANRSAFLRVALLLSAVIRDAESDVRRDEAPEWLLRLVARWHEDEATVITLNYDTLVEAAYTQAVAVRIRRGDAHNYVSVRQIRRAPVSPIGLRIGGTLGHSHCPSFRLVKLHGSIDWLFSGREHFYGEPIFDAHRGHPPGWSTFGVVEDDDLLRDKVPLVVPPTSGKSTFFNNEILRGQWADAHERITNAERVFLIGYSLPPTDEMMRNLLRTALRGEREVIVADPCAAVADRVERLLPRAAVDRQFIRDECAEALAAYLPPKDPHPEFILT
jgi:hypothetical protein